MKGRRFTDNDVVRETVEEWFRTQPKTFFADGIHRLVDQWDTCLNQQGDYVQTVCVTQILSIQGVTGGKDQTSGGCSLC